MLEEIFTIENLKIAYDKIKKKNYRAMNFKNLAYFEQNLERELHKIQKKVFNGSFVPNTAKGIEIPKKNGFRNISLMEFEDRLIQRALSNYLNKLYDPIFTKDSYAYRNDYSCKKATEKVDRLIKNYYFYILDADLKDYFNNINHDILMIKLSEKIKDVRVLHLLKRYLQQIEYRNGALRINEKGLKQGSIISPLLSNIYLDSFDKAIQSKGFNIIRYADDFIILTKTKEDILKAYAYCERLLSLLKLEYNKEKTDLINLSKGYTFKFLGKNFDKNGMIRDSAQSH